MGAPQHNRAIIVHGIGKKPGKLIVGALEVFNVGLKRCLDLFSGKPVGFYGCHHVADSQGFFFKGKGGKGTVSTASTGIARCLDATGAKAGEPCKLEKCDESVPGQQWAFDRTAESDMLRNAATGLCADPMMDPDKYPKDARGWGAPPRAAAATRADARPAARGRHSACKSAPMGTSGNSGSFVQSEASYSNRGGDPAGEGTPGGCATEL